MNQSGSNATPHEVTRFRWWFKGRTPEGNTCRFEGDGWARDSWEAGDNVEKMMRSEHPEMKWMQGKEVEGEGDNRGVKFGPTIQMLKAKRSVSSRAAGVRSGEEKCTASDRKRPPASNVKDEVRRE